MQYVLNEIAALRRRFLQLKLNNKTGAARCAPPESIVRINSPEILLFIMLTMYNLYILLPLFLLRRIFSFLLFYFTYFILCQHSPDKKMTNHDNKSVFFSLSYRFYQVESVSENTL